MIQRTASHRHRHARPLIWPSPRRRRQVAGNMTPWEPSKIPFLVGFAGVLTAHYRELARTTWGLPRARDVLPLLVMGAIPFIPFFVLKDFGQMLVFVGAYATLYLVAVRRWPQLLLFVGSLVLVVASSSSARCRASAERVPTLASGRAGAAVCPAASAARHLARRFDRPRRKLLGKRGTKRASTSLRRRPGFRRWPRRRGPRAASRCAVRPGTYSRRRRPRDSGGRLVGARLGSLAE